ncbi:MAG TPA: hypothetical protein VNF04_00385 [Stellaceae bacterium]|nr:hypothetical protein [Stellaceae bacterium]
MLDLAFGLLCGAALIGTGLAILYLKGASAKPPAVFVLVAHAALGAASLVVLIAALGRGLPQTGMGTAGFGRVAGVLLTLALAAGLALAYAARQRRRPSELLVGTHAGFAIAGFVVLLTLLALR